MTSAGHFDASQSERWRALRMLALALDVPLQSLCVEVFNELLKKHGHRPIVENRLTAE